LTTEKVYYVLLDIDKPMISFVNEENEPLGSRQRHTAIDRRCNAVFNWCTVDGRRNCMKLTAAPLAGEVTATTAPATALSLEIVEMILICGSDDAIALSLFTARRYCKALCTLWQFCPSVSSSKRLNIISNVFTMFTFFRTECAGVTFIGSVIGLYK